MTYWQIGTLVLMGLLVLILFFAYLIDLNKDATYQNRRQKQTKAQLAMIKAKKIKRNRPGMKEKSSYGRIERSPRGPEKRR